MYLNITTFYLITKIPTSKSSASRMFQTNMWASHFTNNSKTILLSNHAVWLRHFYIDLLANVVLVSITVRVERLGMADGISVRIVVVYSSYGPSPKENNWAIKKIKLLYVQVDYKVQWTLSICRHPVHNFIRTRYRLSLNGFCFPLWYGNWSSVIRGLFFDSVKNVGDI